MVVLLFIILMGCAPRPLVRPEAHGALRTSDVEIRLRAETEAWEKAPHLLGGNGRDGIDCSGFVKVLNQKLFGIELPRRAEEQARMGTPVSGKRLKAGDLVFFLLSSKKPHVGIYLSRGEFVHVSSSRGVMISNVNDPYWRNYYWTARRILPM
ncbi:MAG: NlpC/P60 family protein [bacterium]